MASKRDTAVIEAEGGTTTERVAGPHEGEDITHVSRATLEPLGHAFCPQYGAEPDKPEPTDSCADCGFDFRDHNPWFGQPNSQPGDVTVTDYDAKGEAVDRAVPPITVEPELPGMPEGGIWGEYQGRRLTHVALGFGGGPDAPASLAGKLGLGQTVYLSAKCTVASNGFRRDKQTLLPYGTASLHVESVSVAGEPLPVADEVPVPPELIRRSIVEEFVKRAAAVDAKWFDARTEPSAEAMIEGDEMAAELISDLAHLFDPRPDSSDLAAADTQEATASA